MLRVLFVCTGNRCRSPFAAASLATLTEGLPVLVESAGTVDLGPVPPTADAIGVAESMGVDVSRHQARSLHRVDATGFDIVIGFERNHIATAVVDGGVSHERAFLLPELARLMQGQMPRDGGDPAERARAVIAGAHSLRGAEFVPGEEVDDPIGRPVQKYQAVFNQINELNERLVDAWFGARREAPSEQVVMNQSSLWGPETAADSGQQAATGGNGSVAPAAEAAEAAVGSEQIRAETDVDIEGREGLLPKATSG